MNTTKKGDLFEEKCSNKIGIYTIKVTNSSDLKVVALFKGTVYRTSQNRLNSAAD